MKKLLYVFILLCLFPLCACNENSTYEKCTHEWIVTSTTHEDCTNPGVQYSTCSLCGESKSVRYAEPLGHDYNKSGVCVRCGAKKPVTATSSPSKAPSSSSSSATMGEQNALKSAKAYLSLGTGFSRSGLIGQLKYEGYTDSEAEYAVKNCGADWKKEAVKCAAAYLNLDIGFSKAKLIEQLEYEGFTHEQAVYGAEQNGY